MTIVQTRGYQEWQIEAQPILKSLMAAANLAEESTSRRCQAILSAGDQLSAVSNDLAGWIPSHHCPYADIDEMLGEVARSYRVAAELLEAEAKKPSGPDRSSLDRAVTGLIGTLATAWSVMREQYESSWVS